MRPPRNFQAAHSSVINTHLISRALDRRMIFDDVAKEKFRELLAKQCAFSQVELVTFCLMGNHFHLLVRCAYRLSPTRSGCPGQGIARSPRNHLQRG